MLESQRLVVRPCTARPGRRGEERVAEVLDPDQGQQVGYVYSRAPHSRWRRWLPSKDFAVYEADDEPLVFTMQRPWLLARTWEVCDADGHVVGVYRPARRRSRGESGGVIQGRFGDLLGTLVVPPGREEARAFLKPDGLELAQVSAVEGQVVLAFADGVNGNPLLKMLLLAAVVLDSLAAGL